MDDREGDAMDEAARRRGRRRFIGVPLRAGSARLGLAATAERGAVAISVPRWLTTSTSYCGISTSLPLQATLQFRTTSLPGWRPSLGSAANREWRALFLTAGKGVGGNLAVDGGLPEHERFGGGRVVQHGAGGAAPLGQSRTLA